MNFFIYGGRRSGKTTKLVEVLDLFPRHAVILAPWIARHSIPGLTNKVYDTNKGLRTADYIRVYENVENINPHLISFDEVHNIVTCTPDNHKDNLQTNAYTLYKFALKNKWAIIHTSSAAYSNDWKDSLPEREYLGAIQGNWYTEEMAKSDKTTRLIPL